MSDLILSFVLGLIQGLTEFLPVSSSAHLLFPSLIFGSNDYNSISMETIAEEIDSTPYVIATGINGRTKRYFHN